MSVMRTDTTKIILTRNGVDNIWRMILDHYDIHGDAVAWKYLAMLAMREDAGWPLRFIGRIFGHHKGHVQRAIEKIKREIRERFDLSPEWNRRYAATSGSQEIPGISFVHRERITNSNHYGNQRRSTNEIPGIWLL